MGSLVLSVLNLLIFITQDVEGCPPVPTPPLRNRAGVLPFSETSETGILPFSDTSFGGMTPFRGMPPFRLMPTFRGITPFRGIAPFRGIKPFRGITPFRGMTPFRGLAPFRGMTDGESGYCPSRHGCSHEYLNGVWTCICPFTDYVGDV